MYWSSQIGYYTAFPYFMKSALLKSASISHNQPQSIFYKNKDHLASFEALEWISFLHKMSEQSILKCKVSLTYPSKQGMKSPIIFLRLNALYILCIGLLSVLYADESIDETLYEDRMKQGDADAPQKLLKQARQMPTKAKSITI